MSEENRATWADNWLGYREEIKVVDVTIRDGGLMNDHWFEDSVVRGVYKSCVEAGIDYMEIGYINSQQQFPPGEFGPWKHCREEDIRRIVGDNNTSLKLAAMADAEKSDYKTDILPASESVLDMIRVATYIHQMPLALDMIKDASDKGYETTLNLMAVSTVPESEVKSALEMLMRSDVGAVYVVDSFGSLYGEQIRALCNVFLEYCARVPRSRSGSTPTTIGNWPLLIPSKPRYWGPIAWTRVLPAWVAARAIARWSFCWAFCTIRNFACAQCSSALSSTLNRCALNCCGAMTIPT